MLDKLPPELLIHKLCDYLDLGEVVATVSCCKTLWLLEGRVFSHLLQRDFLVQCACEEAFAKYADLWSGFWVNDKYDISVATLEAHLEPQGINAAYAAVGEALDEERALERTVDCQVTGMNMCGAIFMHHVQRGRWSAERLLREDVDYGIPIEHSIVVPLGDRLKVSLSLFLPGMPLLLDMRDSDVMLLAFDTSEPHKLGDLVEAVNDSARSRVPVVLVGLHTGTSRVRCSGKDVARREAFAAYLETSDRRWSQLPRILCQVALVHRNDIKEEAEDCCVC